MNELVIDSNILLASALPQEPVQQLAKAALLYWQSTQMRLVAPRLLRSELVSVVRKAVFQKRIAYEYGRDLLTSLLETAVEFVEDDALLVSAYDIAHRFNLVRAYDSQYLALAERFDCDFWTADEVLYNSVSARFSHIRWLGNWRSPST